jgi:outer membrane protein assembly factor BamD
VPRSTASLCAGAASPLPPGTTAIALALALLAGASSAGCSVASSGGGSVSYRETARSNYDKGLAELKDENYPEAIKYLSYVKSKFPFSRYATLAELRIADAHFAQDKFLEAIDAYKLFMKFHPTHPEVTNGYVAYRIGEGFVQQIPSDWFLVPPSHEKDQGATRDALRELQGFLRLYPQSKYLDKVRALYRSCLRKLADHELYVARFYLENDKPRATILRLETLLSRYPDAGVDPEVMLLLGQTYLKLEQRQKARETFANLIRKYPTDAYSAKAKLYLRFLGER